MKRFVHEINIDDLLNELNKVTSITLVENAFEFQPRDHENSISITSAKQVRTDYATMTRDQLLSLPRKELSSIKDINVLRKLHKDELTLAQQVLVSQANSNYSDLLSANKVKQLLAKLKACKSFFIWPTSKNKSFISKIAELGGEVENSDVRKIVQQLQVGDFSELTLSYLDKNWNSILAIFEYNGPYTFKSIDEDGQDVTIANLDLYIKLDIDSETGEGIGAISFHHPEFPMKHPYNNYKDSTKEGN